MTKCKMKGTLILLSLQRVLDIYDTLLGSFLNIFKLPQMWKKTATVVKQSNLVSLTFSQEKNSPFKYPFGTGIGCG